MGLKKIDLYFINAEKEERLWKEAIIVFDSSALLDIYFYSDTTQDSITNDLFSKLKGRLWIPSQVNYEYQKNREEIIQKPIKEKYKPLSDELKEIEGLHKKITNKLEGIKNSTKNTDRHPHLDQAIFEKFHAACQSVAEEYKTLSETLEKEIKKRSEAITKSVTNDKIYKAIDKHFESGTGFNFTQIMAIVKEGKERYADQIPPGYEDQKKEGTQIYGDLILWKEILDYAKVRQKPILFISEDVKIDWCYKDPKPGEHRIDRPREELIKEMFDYAGVEFWMYTNAQLLYFTNKYLNVSITSDQIAEVKEIQTELSNLANYVNFHNEHYAPKQSQITANDLTAYFDNNDIINEIVLNYNQHKGITSYLDGSDNSSSQVILFHLKELGITTLLKLDTLLTIYSKDILLHMHGNGYSFATPKRVLMSFIKILRGKVKRGITPPPHNEADSTA